MIRLILELHMSKPQAQEDTSSGRNAVQININNLTTKPKIIEVIEADYSADKPPQNKKEESVYVQAIPAGSDRHSEEHAEVNSDGPKAGVDDGLQ